MSTAYTEKKERSGRMRRKGIMHRVSQKDRVVGRPECHCEEQSFHKIKIDEHK